MRRKSLEMLKERASGAVTKPIPLTSILGHDTGGVCQIADDPGGAVRILDKSPVLGALGSARQMERNGAGCDPDRSQANGGFRALRRAECTRCARSSVTPSGSAIHTRAQRWTLTARAKQQGLRRGPFDAAMILLMMDWDPKGFRYREAGGRVRTAGSAAAKQISSTISDK